MPASKRTKNPRGLQLQGPLQGELAAFHDVGLHQRGVGDRCRYRYQACYLRYQEYLGGNEPSLELSIEFLAHLRKSDFAPNTLKIYKAALAAFHEWRGETLKFRVKVPKTKPPYIAWERVEALLEKTKTGKCAEDPKYFVAVGLMAYLGMRESEAAGLEVQGVNFANNTLRYIAKGSKTEIKPIPEPLRSALGALCRGKGPEGRVIGLTKSGTYKLIKRLAPDMHPHDLRHACLTRLLELGANIKDVQEVAGHESLATTSDYIGLKPGRLEETVRLLDAEPARVQEEQCLEAPAPPDGCRLLEALEQRRREEVRLAIQRIYGPGGDGYPG